jgi:hypothetical protein
MAISNRWSGRPESCSLRVNFSQVLTVAMWLRAGAQLNSMLCPHKNQ